MSNIWDDVRSAMGAAKATFSAADQSASAMAEILQGRLRHVNRWTLVQLKKELRDFDAHQKRWKE